MKIATTLKIAIVMMGTLPAAMGAMNAASAAGDPTSGRLKQREIQKCISFSKRVLNAALSQSRGDRRKIQAAYNHYYGNVARCRNI